MLREVDPGRMAALPSLNVHTVDGLGIKSQLASIDFKALCGTHLFTLHRPAVFERRVNGYQSGSEAGSNFRDIDFCITQLWLESHNEEEEKVCARLHLGGFGLRVVKYSGECSRNLPRS